MLLDLTIYLIIGYIMILVGKMIFIRSTFDLMIVLNLITIKLAMVIVLYAMRHHSSAVLDIALTYSMVGFISMSLLARMLLKGGRIK